VLIGQAKNPELILNFYARALTGKSCELQYTAYNVRFHQGPTKYSNSEVAGFIDFLVTSLSKKLLYCQFMPFAFGITYSP